MITLTAKITLADGTIIDLDKKNLLSLSGETYDRADTDTPSWGIISNGGRVEFYDKGFLILNNIENLTATTNSKIQLYVNNTLAKRTIQTAEFYSRKWNYDNNSGKVTIQLQDDLQEWQQIAVPSELIFLNYSLLDVYRELKLYVPSKFKVVADQETLEFLQSVTSETPFQLSGDTLWGKWYLLCECGMLNIFKNKNGEVVVKHNT